MDKCVFCEIVAKKIDAELTVFEDEHVIAQISLHQKSGNYGHVLVIPKSHVQNIYQLPDELDAPMMSALRLVARATKKAFSTEGILIRQNNESASGQDVFHLHFHVIPRYHKDNFETKKYEILPLQKRRELSENLKLSINSEREQQNQNC